MTWICKKGCHKTDKDDFEVQVAEMREDYILHFYPAENKDLNDDARDPKVYCGDDSKWGDAECSVCEGPVEWVEGTE